MSERTLTLKELNRATLARQLLLPDDRRPWASGDGSGARASRGAVAASSGAASEEAAVLGALDRVAGLQAQANRAGYVGLWARVPGLRRELLTELLHRRLVVKATLMRGTIHLVTAEEYLRLRPAVQPLLKRLAHGFIKQSGAEVSFDDLKAEADGFFDEPRTVAELRAMLGERHKDARADRLALALLVGLALVRVPSEGAQWGFAARAVFIDAETWLGRPVPAPAGPRDLILRYLSAFGPASVADIQAWSGLAGVRRDVEQLRPELRTFRNERGDELLDVPGGPLPPVEEPLPPVLVPEWDSVLLGHDDRGRIVPDEYREPVYNVLRQLIGPCALLDGFAAATWKLERQGGGARKTATLSIAPFRDLAPDEREALAREGERLVRFMEPQTAVATVDFTRDWRAGASTPPR